MSGSDPAERWISVPDFEGAYEISDCGRLRSWYMGNNKRRVPRIKKLQKTHNGYYCAVLSHGTFLKSWLISRLVLTAFVGSNTRNLDACHNNGIRTDNRLENLRWATRKENEADKIRHGTQAVGDRNGMRKLW